MDYKELQQLASKSILNDNQVENVLMLEYYQCEIDTIPVYERHQIAKDILSNVEPVIKKY